MPTYSTKKPSEVGALFHAFRANRRENSRRRLEPRPGVCMVCGCTDQFGCAEGCWWVDAAHTLCSRCATRVEPEGDER